jgi:hypothetical protein
VKREHIEPLSAKPSGQLVTIDRSILGELSERLADALGAIERGNRRAIGTEQLWTCVTSILATGIAPAGCPANSAAR